VTLGVARAFGVGVLQLIDQEQRGLARQRQIGGRILPSSHRAAERGAEAKSSQAATLRCPNLPEFTTQTLRPHLPATPGARRSELSIFSRRRRSRKTYSTARGGRAPSARARSTCAAREVYGRQIDHRSVSAWLELLLGAAFCTRCELGRIRPRSGAERKPALLLVDELEHTNAEGSRHAKRHQDVEGCSMPASTFSRRSTSSISRA